MNVARTETTKICHLQPGDVFSREGQNQIYMKIISAKGESIGFVEVETGRYRTDLHESSRGKRYPTAVLKLNEGENNG